MKINLELLDNESATEAIQTVAAEAGRRNINWAVVGGLAMALYGSDRNTKDIDVIASELLPLESVGQLRQGGERYLIKTRKNDVAVDWILRKDEFKGLFGAALADATEIDGVPVLTPEWIVILKFIAGRFKDQEDAIFLLSRQGLVDRKLIRKKIRLGARQA
ncbi:MAG: hypothetical protein IPK58_13990 [Acidobacteria bacterium]|nr:hypothetical protein [Acidobacteriota bacterium]